MRLPTPKEMADELQNNAFLTEDQASTIAADVYQPLMIKVERVECAVLRLTACLARELGSETAKSIINEMSIEEY